MFQWQRNIVSVVGLAAFIAIAFGSSGGTPPPSGQIAPVEETTSDDKDDNAFTPEQITFFREVLANYAQNGTTFREDSSGTLHVTFAARLDQEEPQAIYKMAELLQTADRATRGDGRYLGKLRYVHFYNAKHTEVATFSPYGGLKLIK